MERDHRKNAENSSAPRDISSEPSVDARRSVDPPYRDRREALVMRRRALAREHEEIARAAEQSARIARHLELVDEELRASALPMLESIAIGRPCRARWEEMIGDDVVRRCARCDRDVHDLSRMTRDEAQVLLASAGSPYVRLRLRADGRIVTAECPIDRDESTSRALALAIAVGAVLGANATIALALLPTFRDARTASIERPPLTSPSPARPTVPAIRADAFRTEPEPDVTMGQSSIDAPAPITVLDLDHHVRWLGPATWEIDHALIERALATTGGLHGRAIPHERAGRVIGVRLYGIRRDTTLGRLGFRNGDTLLDVNGYELASPTDALEAYARLRDAPAFFIRLERDGEERVHVIRVAR